LAFEADAEAVLSRVRDAFAQIVESLRGNTRQGKDLHQALGIDKTLAWKILKVAHGADLFMIVQHVPGPAGVKTFLEAAKRREVPARIVESATAAVADFEQLIDRHAGDRASLEMMAAGFAKHGRASSELGYRKAAVRGNSYTWGVHAATQLKADFMWPGSQAGQVDIASLRGLVGFRRLRRNVPWVIARARCTDNDGETRRPFTPTPIDRPAPESEGIAPVPLLRDFCSEPLPSFRRVAGGDGFLEDELVAGPVGIRGAVTCITGEISRNVASYFRDEHNLFGDFIVRLRTPCDTLIFDLFVHEGLFRDVRPELGVYSELAGGAPYPAGDRIRNRLSVSASVDLLGKGPGVVHSPDVPRYAEMVRYVLGKLAWDGNCLSVYRVRLQFPPIPTSVVMRYELRERPH